MTVYKVEQETWNTRRLGDFALPRLLGHRATLRSAEALRDNDILRIARDRLLDAEGSQTTADDYRITRIEVLP